MGFNYEELGFKCGLEIHQQLVGKKLFCNCPTTIIKDSPDFSFHRVLRVAKGEAGEEDLAALHEQEKGKSFEYHAYNDLTCLVEMDEEPPHPLNKDALITALQVCKLLNAKVVDQVHVMRKIVIDGSNVSGFQRTALIGVNGWLEVNGKRVGIPTICLEEEACQVVKRSKSKDTYNLSRLGIPLIEIATDASISTPQECVDVAARIGMILRSTGKVRRGIGSIRQDVNMSIRGAGRVEIKGFQEYKAIPRVIDNEIKRQLGLLKKGVAVEPQVRKAEPDFSTTYLRPMPGAARMYPETDIPRIAPPSLESVETPVLLSEKAERYETLYKLPKGYGAQLVKGGVEFELYVEKFKNLEPLFIAEFFIKFPKDLKKREGVSYNPEEHLEALELFNEHRLPKSAFPELMLKLLKGERVDPSRYKPLSLGEVEEEVKKEVARDPSAPVGAVMGALMKRLKGRVEGKVLMELVKKHKR